MASRPSRRTIPLPALVVAAAAALATAGAAEAATCSAISLKGAKGVIGPKHSYKFGASCSETTGSSHQTKIDFSGIHSISKSSAVSFEILGKASWDRASGQAEESTQLSSTSAGGPTGSRIVTAVCNQDPFLLDPPGAAAVCKNVDAKVSLDSGTLYAFLVAKKFWLAKGVSLAEATALSQVAASGPPPPPPPKPKANPPSEGKMGRLKLPGGSQPAEVAKPTLAMLPAVVPDTIGVEAEALLGAGQVAVHGGRVGPQDMAGFGGGWSGNTQLFWADAAEGDALDLTVQVPQAGKWSVAVYFTKAPDFGQVELDVDGKPATGFDGYAPAVEPSGPVRVGSFDLAAGPRPLRFRISGRNPASSNTFVGIDRIEMVRAKTP